MGFKIIKRIGIPFLAVTAGVSINLGHLCLKASILYTPLFILLCILLTILSLFCSLFAYRLGGKLSTVFSLMAASQLINFPIAAYFLNEHITVLHWLGLLILLGGSILLLIEST